MIKKFSLLGNRLDSCRILIYILILLENYQNHSYQIK